MGFIFFMNAVRVLIYSNYSIVQYSDSDRYSDINKKPITITIIDSRCVGHSI